VGKYGTNLEGFGAFEGGVNADKGAPLVSTSSDGETALLFGPAALREIQAGVANGDFAIPPDEADATITAENPLPYWTFTDVNSAGAITCSIVNDATTASTNALRWSIAASTTTGKSATLTRFVPVAGSANRAFAYLPEITFKASATTVTLKTEITLQYYKADQTTTTGGSATNSATFSTALQTSNLNIDDADITAPADAAFALITVTISTLGTTPASVTTNDLYEVNIYVGGQILLVPDASDPATYAPAVIRQESGELRISPPGSAKIFGNLTLASKTGHPGNLTAAGDITAALNIGFGGAIYGTTALTGPNIDLGGTNTRAWTHSTTAADVAASLAGTVAGILVTKSLTGQPSTTVNGTGTTDAFADAVRNGGLALDNTNQRFYVYSSGAWRYAALTNPSDSRLKEEITAISGALDTLRQLMPVAFKWKAAHLHERNDSVADDGKRLGFIADQVATTDLKHWVEAMNISGEEAEIATGSEEETPMLAVNIPQNEMEALVVQALLDIDTRLKALEAR